MKDTDTNKLILISAKTDLSIDVVFVEAMKHSKFFWS